MRLRRAAAVLAALWMQAAAAQTDLAALNQGALDRFVAGDTAGAAEIAEQALAAARARPDADPNARATAFNNLAFLLSTALDSPGRAEDLWRESLLYMGENGHTAHPANLTTMVQLGEHMARRGQADQARPLLERAMRLARETDLQGAVAAALTRFYLDTGAYPQAVVALTEVTLTQPELIEGVYGDLYTRLSQLIETAEGDGRWQDVVPLIEGKLLVLRRYYPLDNRDQAMRNLMFNRYFALVQIGDYDRARSQILVWKATGTLSQDEQDFVRNMRDIALPLAEGANINTLERLETVRMAVLFAQAVDDTADPRLALALRTIATAEGYFGQHDRVEDTLRQGMALLERSEQGHRHLHLLYDDLAWAAYLRGDPDRAETLFARSDAAQQAAQALGPDPEAPLDRAWRAGNRARFLLDTGRPEPARTWIARAQAVLDGPPGANEDAWHRALTRARLADLGIAIAFETGAGIDLAPLLAEIDALRRIAPEASPDYTMVLANAADSALASGDIATARALLTEAVAHNRTALPEIAPQALDTQVLLAQLELVSGNRAAARRIYRRVTEARKAPLYQTTLPQAASEFEQFAWLLIDRPDPSPRAVAEAFEALQWTQITQSAEAMAVLETRLSVEDPSRGALLRQRQDLTEAYAGLSARLTDSFGSGTRHAATAQITTDLDAIEAQLARVDTTLDALGLGTMGIGRVKPLPLAEVQALLRPGEMLITFLLPSLNPDYIPGLDGAANHVIGVTAQGVNIARMGEISRRVLNERIQAFRCDMAVSDPGCDTGGAQGLRGAMAAGGPKNPKGRDYFDLVRAHALYADLFGDLAGLLPDYPQLIIAPPPDLLRLPFQALITSKTLPDSLAEADWLIRRHAIAVLPSIASLRTLRAQSDGARRLERMLGVGDPVIGAASPVACGALHLAALRAAPPADRPLTSAAPGEVALADVGFLSTLPRLPDSRCELEAIGAGFDSGGSRLVTGAAATETRIKQMDARGALAEFDVLVFATHGLTAGEAGATAPGLVLTPPQSASLEDDGLLSAAEIAMLDLDAQLVVLSACNTAAGANVGEDGLSGLARAFFHSGARSLLVTHWSVYSEAAVALSTGLFAQIRAEPDLGFSRSLQRATLDILNDPGRPDLHHHPAYWAAFSIVGAS